jgi:hypothetical protein
VEFKVVNFFAPREFYKEKKSMQLFEKYILPQSAKAGVS